MRHYPQMEKTWRRDRSTKITMRVHWQLILEITKEPRIASNLPQLRSVFSNKKEIRQKWHPMESFKMKTTADQKEQKDLSCIYKKKTFWQSPKFWGKHSVNWCDKCFLQSLRPVTCGLKIAEYFTKRTSYQESNIIMRVCFAALGPGWLAVIDGTLNSAFSRKPLPENPEGDCSAIHWGSSTEWPKYTSKSTFKWLQKTKKN